MHKMLTAVITAIVALVSFAFGQSLVLQNGTDNYLGCDDTYLSDNEGQNENYGDETMCSLQGYH